MDGVDGCTEGRKLIFSAGLIAFNVSRECNMRIRRLAGPWILILACIGAGQLDCRAQAPLPPSSTAPSIPSPNSAQTIAAHIQALAAQISSLNEEIAVLRTQLEHLRATKPQSPPNDASPAVKTAYANALQVWNNQMQAAEQRIQTLQARIDALEHELTRLASQVAAVQRTEIAKQQAALATAKKNLNQAIVVAAGLKPAPTKPGAKTGAGSLSPASGLP